MNRWLIASTVGAIMAFAISIGAQNPPANPQSQPQTRAPAAEGAIVTVEGCLVREADVPGRKPNIAERAGVMEDYILTSTKIVKGAAPSAQARPGEPIGTAGTAAMYHVKGISDERLKPLLGRRVQVEGKLTDVDKPAAPTATTADLPDLQGATISQVSGDCPATR